MLHRNGRLFPPNHLHESWLDHLSWDTELELACCGRNRFNTIIRKAYLPFPDLHGRVSRLISHAMVLRPGSGGTGLLRPARRQHSSH